MKLDYKVFILIDLNGTVIIDSADNKEKRKQSRIRLINNLYHIPIEKAKKAISTLEEIIYRYKKHRKVPSPPKQLEILSLLLKIPLQDDPIFKNEWFNMILKIPPKIDEKFVSLLKEITKQKKNIIITGSYLDMLESVKHVRKLLEDAEIIDLFFEIYPPYMLKAIPPSPMAFFHIPPQQFSYLKIAISPNEDFLKSAIYANYQETFLWKPGEEIGGLSIFPTFTNYSNLTEQLLDIILNHNNRKIYRNGGD